MSRDQEYRDLCQAAHDLAVRWEIAVDLGHVVVAMRLSRQLRATEEARRQLEADAWAPAEEARCESR